MEGSVAVKRAGRNRQLTDRDKELCGFLAVCRYWSREQIERLMFPGRTKARSSTRLRQLASNIGGQAAVLRGDLGFASAEGWTTVWALTAEGFAIGSRQLGLNLQRAPKHDVGPMFLRHEVMLNEVLLGLVAQDGKTPAKMPRQFRWILGEYLDLPFTEMVLLAREPENRRLQPDALLEDPAGRRRYFIEYETGSATVRDAKKSTSTMAKLDRYAEFLVGYAGNPFHGERDTFYTRLFKDTWPAEVLFVSPTEARRDTIARVICERAESIKTKIAARSLTLTEAHRYLCHAVYNADRPPGGADSSARRLGPPAPPTAIVSLSKEGPARSAAEERLRRGRVSVRGEALVNFEKAMRSSLAALASAQEVLARLKVPPDAIPKAPSNVSSIVRVLAEYASRGEEALSIHDLSAAD